MLIPLIIPILAISAFVISIIKISKKNGKSKSEYYILLVISILFIIGFIYTVMVIRSNFR